MSCIYCWSYMYMYVLFCWGLAPCILSAVDLLRIDVTIIYDGREGCTRTHVRDMATVQQLQLARMN